MILVMVLLCVRVMIITVIFKSMIKMVLVNMTMAINDGYYIRLVFG